MMEITEGSHAVAEAVRLCRPQVVSAYPITPQTHIVEALAEFVANCQLDAEYITVENELSALSACIGAHVPPVRGRTPQQPPRGSLSCSKSAST